MITKIITDSSANTFMPAIASVTHGNVPLTIKVGSSSWLDDGKLDIAKFVLTLKNTKERTSTACPSLQAWLDSFVGADQIFVLTLTSALSGTYNSALQAAKIFTKSHPNVKIHVFDTRSAGPQIRLLAEDAAQMVNQNCEFDQIVAALTNKIKQTDLLFILENLDNLANNGRINPAIARIARLLKLNVFGTASDAGEFEMLGKAHGSKKLFAKMVQVMKKSGYCGGKVLIDYVRSRAKADKMKQAILTDFPAAEVSLSECGGLCAYYAEDNGLMIGYEKKAL